MRVKATDRRTHAWKDFWNSRDGCSVWVKSFPRIVSSGYREEQLAPLRPFLLHETRFYLYFYPFARRLVYNKAPALLRLALEEPNVVKSMDVDLNEKCITAGTLNKATLCSTQKPHYSTTHILSTHLLISFPLPIVRRIYPIHAGTGSTSLSLAGSFQHQFPVLLHLHPVSISRF
jgi:hypothetical protein